MAELKTFLFTDISGSVRLKNEMSGRSVTEKDIAFIQSILTPHRERIEARLEEFGGRVVSTAGDGHFLVFDNTVQAALWAVSVQESHRDSPIPAPGGANIEVRISVHAGVPQIDPGDPNNFIGKTVDYAARLNDYAAGGQILVSRSVMAILDDIGLEGLELHLHGKRLLKGIGDVDVHELLYDDHGPRPLRNSPKAEPKRQWTVVPTQGFDGGETGVGQGGGTSLATALRRVGNYELEEQLGAGGMGDVYKARHVQFGRIRAVKVIKPQFVASGNTDVIRRFYNEIKAVGRLEHKNIVVAIDSSSPTDKVHYLVMEYIEGVSLDELVAQHGPLPIAESCEIIRQAARGLQYIHKNDMVHRDIKPSNLMITMMDGDQVQNDSTLTQADGQRAIVKILDLGLALLAADQHDRLTRLDHKAMGTGMYMPPEQWKTTSVDIRADIYSLGCTLYHLLAGNPPFFDSDLRPEKAHEKSAVPPIQTGGGPIPKKLWDVVRKMLEKRPDDRYATPADVAAALSPFCEGQDLTSLVRGKKRSDMTTMAFRDTQAGASRIETRRSRSLFSGIDRRTRRWLRSAVLPLALMGVFATGIYWVLTNSNSRLEQSQREAERLAEETRLATLKQAESDARVNLPSFAKHAARTALPDEMQRRFEVLTDAAKDPEMIAALRKLNVAVPAGREALDVLDATALADLDKWIATTLAHGHGSEMAVDSWFITNAAGVQVARSPKAKSIGESYRSRDYFHGQGRDLARKDPQLATTGPIKRNHLSQVYRSSTSGLLKVAFSVPIWDAKPNADGDLGEREVIGVLAMSVNVHDFTVLDKELAGDSEVVLVDLRPDGIDGPESRGLVLHHPRLDKGKLARIDPELLKAIDAAQPLKAANFDGKDHFQVGYIDPLAENANQEYWGTFEPVKFKVGDVTSPDQLSDRPGWIVLVQKPIPMPDRPAAPTPAAK